MTPIPTVFDLVKEEASRRGVGVLRSELVGLAPLAAFAGRSPQSVGLDGFREGQLLDRYVDVPR